MKKLTVVASPFFAFMLFSLIILSACGSSDLDRNKAKSIIDKTAPSIVIIILSMNLSEYFATNSLHRDVSKNLIKNGYLTPGDRGGRITSKILPFLVNNAQKVGEEISTPIKYGNISHIEITGIATKDDNTKIVECRVDIVPNELGKIAGNKTTLPLVTIFSRYDDGWRVELDLETMGKKDKWYEKRLVGFYQE